MKYIEWLIKILLKVKIVSDILYVCMYMYVCILDNAMIFSDNPKFSEMGYKHVNSLM
jgi:hypothetical protein